MKPNPRQPDEMIFGTVFALFPFVIVIPLGVYWNRDIDWIIYTWLMFLILQFILVAFSVVAISKLREQ